MAKYVLPKMKPMKKSKSDMMGVTAAPDEWRRRITIPVNKAILDAVEIGEQETIVLKGKVKGINQNTNAEQDCCDLTLEISSVECGDY